MNKEPEIEKAWRELISKLSATFAGGEALDLESVFFLIGVQELGMGYRDFSKDDKVNLIHIGVCAVLEPAGYYTFIHRDNDGWPHYKLLKELPEMNPEAQTEFLQKAILGYFNIL